MPKAKRQPKTHFQQVPLTAVKAVVNRVAPKTDAATPKNVIIERKTEPYTRIRP